jgi:hypothetical protein
VEWGIRGLKSIWRKGTKCFDSTKEKYNHLFIATTLLTNFLHMHCYDFIVEIVNKHQMTQ